MATTPEGRVKEKVKSMLKEKDAWFFMPPASPYGKRGVPDFVGCINGMMFGIETKAGKRAKLTAFQEMQRDAILAAGGAFAVVRDSASLDEASVMLDSLASKGVR